MLAQRVQDGEIVWLGAKEDRFLSIFSEQLTEKAQGAAIIIHGMGGHADWPDIVAPLRRDLPVVGWATLSVQMPILAPSDTLADYGKTVEPGVDRIKLAIQYLRDRKYLNIVIIGHSFGAATVASYLAENRDNRIQAFVGIAMQAQNFLNPRLDLYQCIERIAIPVLDIYGSRDFDEVVRFADNRRMSGRKTGLRNYQQVVIEGADHYFTGQSSLITRRIRGWLDKAAPGVRVKADEEIEEEIQPSEEENEGAAQ